MVVTPELVEMVADKVQGKGEPSPESQERVVDYSSLCLPPTNPNVQDLVTPENMQRAELIGWIRQVMEDPEVQQKLNEQAEISWEVLEQINPNAAGLDIGSEEIWTCVPHGRDKEHVRMFETFTPDLTRLVDWLVKCRVDTVAMESTGVYWIPIYDMLEARGITVVLVNARHIKNVPGRKTDVQDCQWIQKLHTYGLLQASFRPPADICAMRTYVRHRERWIELRASQIQYMQKSLLQMNLQLTLVLKDITGQTGMDIIRSIVAGERDPVKLAEFRDPHCKHSQEEIAKALTGNYLPEHLFTLRQGLESYDAYTQQIKACDAELERLYGNFEPVVDIQDYPLPPLPKHKRRRSKGAPDYDLRSYLYQLCGVDLVQIDGLDVILVQKVLAEIGIDMSKWPTAKHFTSWLRLAPHNDISGGKVLRSKTGKTTNRAAQAFRMAAQSVGKTKTALGAFYRRMRTQHGPAKAIVATANKIARIVYHMLKDKRAYIDRGAEHYEEKYKERVLKNLERKAAKLGLKLVPAVS